MRANLPYFFAFLFLFSGISASAQEGGKTLIKSFNLFGKETVELHLKGEVEVKPWSNNYLRVLMHVSLPPQHNSLLKGLVRTGRYSLKSKIDGDVIKIYAPGLEKEVRVRNQYLNDQVRFTIYAPENVQVQLGSEVSAWIVSENYAL